MDMEGGPSAADAAAAAAPSAITLQLLVSLPWGDSAAWRKKTRVLPVPVPLASPADVEEGTTATATATTTAGALLAPLIREAELAAGGRALPPLVATYHGQRYQMHEFLPLASDAAARASGFDVLHISLARGGLLGGKGGFGAMLRSMGKGAGVKKTTDFGACRDLYGRRLRHVNDEIRLKKWLEDKERESEGRDRKRGQKAQDKTPSGIDGWYLSVPSWAELKPSNANAHRQANQKTSLCKHWMQARENGRQPPPGAPLHWGCPSGRRCNFAHGDEELRGEALEKVRAMEREMAERQREFEKDRYMGAQALAPPVDVQSAVLEGLKVEARARKKGKTGPLELYGGAPGGEGEDEEEQKKKGGGPGVLPIGFGTGEVSWSTQSQCPWMETLSGSLNVGAQGTLSGGIVGEFATAIVPLRRRSSSGQPAGGETPQQPPPAGVGRGAWYYEVEAVSAEGSVQVGWVTDDFDADANEGDGVGDDRNSWGFNPSQGKAWHNEEERDYGPGEKWEVGDVLGVLLELDGDANDGGSSSKKKAAKAQGGGGGRLSFFLNGQPLGVAFDSLPLSSSSPSSGADDQTQPTKTLVRYYPALSLDEGEALRVNIGTRPFAFPQCLPAGAKPVAAALSEPADVRMPPSAAATPAVASAASAPATAAAAASTTTTAGNGKKGAKAAAASQPAAAGQEAATKPAAAAAGGKKTPPPPEREVSPEALDLSGFTAPEELEALGLDRLKAALMALGVKCGGTLQERAARLWSLRGIEDPSEIDPKLRVKSK